MHRVTTALLAAAFGVLFPNIETAFWTNWTAKIKYLHVEFSSEGYFNPSPALGVDIAATFRSVTRSCGRA